MSELSRVSALTLYSFWEPQEDRWMSQQELEEGGMEDVVAAEVVHHLDSSLRPAVQAAMEVRWTVWNGDWCMDLWTAGEEAFYDLVLRVTEC